MSDETKDNLSNDQNGSSDKTSPVINSSNGGEGSSVGSSIDYKSKVDALTKALNEAKIQYEKAANELESWLWFWGVALVMSICVLLIFSTFMYNNGYDPLWSNREFLYTLIFRLIIALAIFSAVAFCIKMLRSHIHLYQYTRHKSTIVNSMASLLGSAENYREIHSKLMDILLDFGNSGIEKKQRSDIGLKEIQNIIKVLNKEG